MTRFARSVAAAAIALAAVACSQTDSGVTSKIKAKFAQDDLVKAHEINVTTHDHIVTLSGEVESMAAKERAMQLARETRGVTSVVDDLHLEAAATTGERDYDVDVDLDDDIENGASAVGKAIKDGAEATAEGARQTGKAIRDAVTDGDRDSDRDGR